MDKLSKLLGLVKLFYRSSWNFQHDYFDGPTKLFSDLCISKFFNTILYKILQQNRSYSVSRQYKHKNCKHKEISYKITNFMTL